ncbi:peptidase inhibitor family I36 protein [Streptomyces sp. DG2A-72]|uniref:peptidase inhibitor family I36 protein n=1 Tax=Streptomyces sp. DG2A-72 TaxID=3051386 RepID=UPI00265B8C2D|nr:peptidase inhibitor family I36 protein [Streptomyces sp. DG2A-72]MDO0935738.1 peptidase inhibitor family I36 protein [Streptomyces sp. DG2A-72]
MLKTVRARAATLLAGALLACAGAVASGTHAHAAAGDCSSGAFCVYSEPFLGGQPREFFGPLPAGYVIDNVESIYNNSTCDVTVSSDYAGSLLVIQSGTAVHRVPSYFGDTIADIQWTNCS